MNIKRMIIAGLFAAFATGVYAQEDMTQGEEMQKGHNQGEYKFNSDEDTPQAVQESFNQEFASAEDVEWEEREGGYEAEFEEYNTEKTARFTESGMLEHVRTEIDKKELPDAVMESLNNDFGDYRIKGTYMLEQDNGTFYKVKVKKDGKTEKLIFDDTGSLIDKSDYKERM